PLQLSISNNLTWFWVKADGRGACVGRRKRLGSDEPPSLVTSTRSSFASSPLPRLDPRWLGSTLDISLEHEIACPRWEGAVRRTPLSYGWLVLKLRSVFGSSSGEDRASSEHESSSSPQTSCFPRLILEPDKCNGTRGSATLTPLRISSRLIGTPRRPSVVSIPRRVGNPRPRYYYSYPPTGDTDSPYNRSHAGSLTWVVLSSVVSIGADTSKGCVCARNNKSKARAS
ncbi:hypothetical protein THAOC_29272, partial [Thalassiosira oceanica]